MFELVPTYGNTWYIDCPAKLGLWVQNGEAWLIDSGSDKDAGRRVRKILDEQGWRLRAIINTHSHADHIGGNAYLQKQTGCDIFAPAVEDAFVRYPVLEPTCLFGGCPPGELRHKFLMAQPSEARVLAEDCLPEGFAIIPLPGHSPAQVGIRTPDDVLFIADSISSEKTLKKYGVTVLYDVAAALESLVKLKGMTANLFVPAHVDASANIARLVDKNIASIAGVAETILGLCKSPVCFDDLLAGVFAHYKLAMSVEQYVLVGSTVKSYLAWMRDSGGVDIVVENNHLLWQATNGVAGAVAK